MSTELGITAGPSRRERGATRTGCRRCRGEFAFSSDMFAEGMLWGHMVRSPHPAARIRGIDISGALRIAGVRAVLTSDDVPGRKTYGLDYPDQPVFAWDVVQAHGRAGGRGGRGPPRDGRGWPPRRSSSTTSPPSRSPTRSPPSDAAADPSARQRAAPPEGPLRATPRRPEPSSSRVTTRPACRTRPHSGTESGLAIPAEDGGVDLYIATQWLHIDQEQMAACLDLPLDKVRLHLAGVGGSFGAREDLSMQVQICLLALRTGRPVKMVFSREESFLGHVHRHPATMWYRHHADAEGRLVKVEARIILDGGAYLSTLDGGDDERRLHGRRGPTGSPTPSSRRSRSGPTTHPAGR